MNNLMNKLYGIGVGVGDSDNLTVKAANLLKKLDVVILPESKKNGGSTAFEIAEEFLKDEIIQVFLEFPMVKDPEIRVKSRIENAKVIEHYLDQGLNVGFLTIGDPMIYSTYSYILEYLDKKYSVETISGIPSFVDISALVNIPLTIGDESLKVISLNDNTDIESEIQDADNIVFMKAYKNFSKLKTIIKSTGNLENSFMVSNCGKNNQEIYFNLSSVEEIGYFTTVIIKKGGISKWKKSIL